MMKPLLALSLLLTTGDITPDSRDDAIAIMRTVIAKETIYKGAPLKNRCVVAKTDGATFAGRTYRLYATKEEAAKETGAPTYAWNTENSKILSEAISSIWARKSSERLVQTVQADWLPPFVPLCTPSDEWRTLTFTSPAIQGDIAFVYVEFKCPLCGHGALYALRRTGSEWKIIDGATMWVS